MAFIRRNEAAHEFDTTKSCAYFVPTRPSNYESIFANLTSHQLVNILGDVCALPMAQGR